MDKEKKNFEGTGHFIAYLDILGYEGLLEQHGIAGLSEIIHNSIEHAEGKKSVLKHGAGILSELMHYKKIEYEKGVKSALEKRAEEQKDKPKHIKSKIFSDNFFFCTEEDYSGLFTLVRSLQAHLIKNGVFIRGALCYGSIYFDENFICGNGLIKAYKLENEVAIFPRIIIDDSLIDSIQKPKIDNSFVKDIDQDQVFREFIIETHFNSRIDFDGYGFINYLTLPLSRQEFFGLLESHRNYVIDNLEKSKNNNRIKQKYQWARNFHNNFCEENYCDEYLIP